MQNEISAILDQLVCDSVSEIIQGLAALEQILRSFAPSIRKCHQTGVVDSKLAHLVALQNNFQFNITAGLISVYQFFAKSSQEVDEDVLINVNYLLSGMLLIHPESRSIFGHSKNMALVLSFLDSETNTFSENLSISFVSLLIHILIKNVKNMRTFEANEGCQILIQRLSLSSSEPHENKNTDRQSTSQQHLHFKVIEFLIFYLADESELLHLPQNAGARGMSIREKADLFRPKFSGIDDLIKSLNDLTSLRSIPGQI